MLNDISALYQTDSCNTSLDVFLTCLCMCTQSSHGLICAMTLCLNLISSSLSNMHISLITSSLRYFPRSTRSISLLLPIVWSLCLFTLVFIILYRHTSTVLPACSFFTVLSPQHRIACFVQPDTSSWRILRSLPPLCNFHPPPNSHLRVSSIENNITYMMSSLYPGFYCK